MYAMQTVHIIYASSSGHTEYVVDVLEKQLQAAGVSVSRQLAESAQPQDLLRGDVLVLGSGTWNTGSVEGQLNPHMHDLLLGRAKDIDLSGKQSALIALGDERYYYTLRAGEYLRTFVQTHGGSLICEQLSIVNEPYGQEERIEKWGVKFLASLQS